MEKQPGGMGIKIKPRKVESGTAYDTRFVTHVETATVAQVRRARVSRLVDKWLIANDPLFPASARQAIQHVQRLWEACPTLGRLTASYQPRSAISAVLFEDRFASGA